MKEKSPKICRKSAILRPKVILASASPRRQEMLRNLGIAFHLASTNIVEEWQKSEDPKRVAIRLAKAKVLASQQDGLVIGMDTIVAIGKTKLGKPTGTNEAREMLRSLSGRMHIVVTGVALRYQGKMVMAAETTRVYFRRIEESEIEWYIKTEEPFDKAGAYAIQGFAGIFIKKIDGCYFNVIGFPIFLFQKCLQKLGFQIYDLME